MLWVVIQGRGDDGGDIVETLGCSVFDWLFMEITVFSSMTTVTMVTRISASH